MSQQLTQVYFAPKGPSSLAVFASVSLSVMAPLPNSFLCFSRMYGIAREKQRELLGGCAIADVTLDVKNASVDGPSKSFLCRHTTCLKS
jgi:hypothetical protein